MLKEKFKKAKDFVKNHKKEILIGAGVFITTSIAYSIVILSKNKRISDLEDSVEILEGDVDVVKGVLTETVLDDMSDSYLRKIRYNQTKYDNAVTYGNLSEIELLDKQEEIDSLTDKYLKINDAKRLLTK